MNCIASKKSVIYAKKNLVQMTIELYSKTQKVRNHCHCTGKYSLRYKTPKEIPVVFHNSSKYGYHFIIKELAEEFEEVDRRKVHNFFSVNKERT